MKKPSNVEAIRFHGFVFRHFGNGFSNNKGQTWYLFDDNYQKYYKEIWHNNSKIAKREDCLLIQDVYKLFKMCEKKYGPYGTVDDDIIEEFLIKKLPIK